MAVKTKSEQPLQLAVVRPSCAAIDVGSMMMMVSYSDSGGNQHLLETGAFTEDLEELAKKLRASGITEVAMEATGSYWMPLYEILEQNEMKITLANPRHFKNVDAQKTDVKDSQWLHQLHAHGLLRSSHVAQETYRELRSYLHERNLLQKQKSDTLNRVQRLLTEMNIKIQHLISDVEGLAGMKILRAIAAGNFDPESLVSLINVNLLKADKNDLLKSLKGNYKPQYICILQHQLSVLDFFKAQMKDYDLHIEDVLKRMLPEGCVTMVKAKKSPTRKNQYSINVKEYMHRIAGVDLTEIEGLNEISILEIISVTGIDMSKWKSSDHFTSWLNLSPRPKKSGGKIIGSDKRATNNKASQAFRMGAQSMWKNKGKLGHLYRRLSAQRGTKKAMKAVARKLAVIFYHMLKNKTAFDKNRMKLNKNEGDTQKIARLKKEASKYGFVLNSVLA